MGINDIQVLGLPLLAFIAIIVGGVLLIVVVITAIVCIRKRRRQRKQLKDVGRGEYAKVNSPDSKLRPLSLTPPASLHKATNLDIENTNLDVENQAGFDRPTRFNTSSTQTTGTRDGSPKKLRKQKGRYEPHRSSQGPPQYSIDSPYDDPSRFTSMPYGSLPPPKLGYRPDSQRMSISGSMLAGTPMTETDDPVNELAISYTSPELPPGLPRKSSRRNSSPNPARILAAPEIDSTRSTNSSRSARQSLPAPVIPDRRSSSQPRQLPYPTVEIVPPSNHVRARSESPQNVQTQDPADATFELDAAGTPVKLVRRSSSRYSTASYHYLWTRNATPELPRKSSRRVSGGVGAGSRGQDIPEFLEMPQLPRKSSRRDSQRTAYDALVDRSQLYLD